MIDFHCHILPGIDDGSKDIEETARMLNMENRQGITDIVFTPHFYAEWDRIEQFIKRRQSSYAQTLQTMRELNLLHIHTYLGAEVCYFPGIGHADILSELCIDHSRWMLLELPFCQWDHTLMDDLLRLLEKQNLKIIIAHMERYYAFQTEKDLWNQVLELPMIFQLNAGPLLGKRKNRKFQIKLLKELEHVILGSDCHNTMTRIPNIEQGRAIIQKYLGEERLDRIDCLGSQIIEELK